MQRNPECEDTKSNVISLVEKEYAKVGKKSVLIRMLHLNAHVAVGSCEALYYLSRRTLNMLDLPYFFCLNVN